MKGSKMLQVISIIMIVGAAIGLAFGLLGMFGGVLASAALGSAAAGGIVILISIIGMIGGIIQLIAGIIGVKNWQNPAKAQSCLVMGIVIIVLNLISFIGGVVFNGFSASSVWNAVLSLVLPVLYVVGANQLKSQS